MNLPDINNANTNKVSLTKEDILATLDFEINRISSEQQRNGWTKWALYGVLAGSLWLSLEHWEKGNFDVSVILLLILIFSTVIETIRQAKRLLPFRPSRYKKVPRFKFPTEINSSGGFFLYAIRHFVILIIAVFFANKVPWHQAGLIILYYGKFSFLSLFVFAFFYYPKFEFIYNSESKISFKRYYSYWGLAIIGLIWGTIGYINAALTFQPNGISIANFRIAGLLVVITYTFYLLADISKEIPMLSVLTEIRRELSLGIIDIEAATKQVNTAIIGISVDEQLQDDITSLMPLIEQRSLEFNRINDKITVLIKEIITQNLYITKKHKKEVDEILKSTINEFEELLRKTEEENKLKRRLKIHIAMVDDKSTDAVQSANLFLQRIEDLDSEMTNKAKLMLGDILPSIEKLKTIKD